MLLLVVRACFPDHIPLVLAPVVPALNRSEEVPLGLIGNKRSTGLSLRGEGPADSAERGGSLALCPLCHCRAVGTGRFVPLRSGSRYEVAGKRRRLRGELRVGFTEPVFPGFHLVCV